jgi:hypothetical protein
MSSQARGLQNFISDLRNAKSKVSTLKRAMSMVQLFETRCFTAKSSGVRIDPPHDLSDLARALYIHMDVKTHLLSTRLTGPLHRIVYSML